MHTQPEKTVYQALSESRVLGKSSDNTSNNIDEYFECVIVGSGFGGAVMAARLASQFPAGQLAVLERGKEFLPGDFPQTLAQGAAQFKTPVNPLGLFDFSFRPDMDTLTGNGLGGTSLIYASVTLEPLPEVFEANKSIAEQENTVRVWPQEITYAILKPYFDRVRDMLAVEKYIDQKDIASEIQRYDPALQGSFMYGAEDGTHPISGVIFKDYQDRSFKERPPLAKAELLRDLVTPADTKNTTLSPFQKAPIAINLTQYSDGEKNRFGIPQKKCNLCGDCVTGCNKGAKNTLVMNYLPLAKQQGALLFCQMEVLRISASDKTGYRYRLNTLRWDVVNGKACSTAVSIYTNSVILSAGVFGTGKILLNSQQAGDFQFSQRLGHDFSGNADTISFSYFGKKRLNSVGVGAQILPQWEVGPTITAYADFRQDESRQYMIQEGAWPSLLSKLTGRAFAAEHLFSTRRAIWRDFLKADVAHNPDSALNHSQVWLALGHDQAQGHLHVCTKGKLHISLIWPAAAVQTVLTTLRKNFAQFSRLTGSYNILNPRERFSWLGKRGATPITVHPLGGCCMADDVHRGVTDHVGRVFDRSGSFLPGLYVSDGSLCNGALGANPSLTIAALAERAAEQIIQHDLSHLQTNGSSHLNTPTPHHAI